MLKKIRTILSMLKCPHCNAFTSSDDCCEFCGNPLPKRSLPVRRLVEPWKFVVTIYRLGFLPWTAARQIAEKKKGVLVGPYGFLGATAGIWYLAHAKAAGIFAEIPIFGEPDWARKWVLYILYLTIFGVVSFLFYGFLKAFGSAQRFSDTCRGICYWLGLSALIVAALLSLHIGPIYRREAQILGEIPLWENVIQSVVLSWSLVALIIIESRVHSLQWYKVFASFSVAGAAYLGWVLYFVSQMMVSPG